MDEQSKCEALVCIAIDAAFQDDRELLCAAGKDLFALGLAPLTPDNVACLARTVGLACIRASKLPPDPVRLVRGLK